MEQPETEFFAPARKHFVRRMAIAFALVSVGDLSGCASTDGAATTTPELGRSGEERSIADVESKTVAIDPLGVIHDAQSPGFGPRTPSVFYSNAIVELGPIGEGGASRAEISFSGTRDLVAVRIRATSPHGPSFAACSPVEVFVNGRHLPLHDVRYSTLPLDDGSVQETLVFEILPPAIHTLGCAATFEGRICSSAFELSPGQLEKLHAFHSLLVEKRLLSPTPEKMRHPPCPEPPDTEG